MKKAWTVFAASATLSLALTTFPAARAMAQDRDDNNQRRDESRQVQHPDYSKNKYYALGNREGYQDHERKQQRADHNHKYRNEDDRAAHDYGYQQGWQGQRGYKPDTH